MNAILFALFSLFGESEQLIEANESYKKAIYADTVYERDLFLNEALTRYSELESQSNLNHSSGRLYQTMGNVLTELNAYPFALLYLYRAEKLSPGDTVIQEQIAFVREKLELAPEKRMGRWISTPKMLQLLLLCSLIAIFLGSISKMKPALVATFLVGLLLIGLGYRHYFDPLEAVLVKATRVEENLTPSGTRVKVLDLADDGQKVRVLTPEGAAGFVSADRIRVI